MAAPADKYVNLLQILIVAPATKQMIQVISTFRTGALVYSLYPLPPRYPVWVF